MYEELTDTALLALCIWREARGEGSDGMRAVAHVIRNRIGAPGFPRTLREVILQPNAFTSMSVGMDPEFRLYPAMHDPSYDEAFAIAEAVLAGTDADPTGGAHYYAHLTEIRSGWFFSHIVSDPIAHPHLRRIGSQDFYL